VLNEWNQLHEVKNVFNTDGACMTSANITEPLNERTNCSFGIVAGKVVLWGYFSTQSSTLPAAMKTNNLTVRPLSIVYKNSYTIRIKRKQPG
jgi:hypothetical protein